MCESAFVSVWLFLFTISPFLTAFDEERNHREECKHWTVSPDTAGVTPSLKRSTMAVT